MNEILIKEGDRIKVDAPLEEDFVKEIRSGKTTKEEVLDLFGPPTAIARKGKVMTLPPPGHLKAGFIEVDSETFFEPFSLKFENTDEHIVYYYYHPTVWGSESRLWLYINETNGIVEDYIFRGPIIKKEVEAADDPGEDNYEGY
jgi:hypothetical protein